MTTNHAAEQDMESADPSLEVEVKFLVSDTAALRATLLSGGATLVRPRVYERNVRFDTVENDLLAQGRLLRLREDGRVRLTFKGPPPARTAPSEAKVHEEIELAVDDYEAMATILQRLGYAPVQVYEKHRETFKWGDVEIVLDQLPFGEFIELEGPEPAIKEAAAHFGLDWSKRIVINYLTMMAMLKELFDLPFEDVTFENFTAVQATAADLFTTTQ